MRPIWTSPGISGLSKAIKNFDEDDVEKTGKALGRFADSLDPEKMKHLKESLAGLSIGGSFLGGGGEGGQSIPALITETNRLLKTGLFGSGALLAELQTEANDLGGKAASATVVVTNNSSQQINQSKAMVLPPSPIVAGNTQSALPST